MSPMLQYIQIRIYLKAIVEYTVDHGGIELLKCARDLFVYKLRHFENIEYSQGFYIEICLSEFYI